ncbi:MAG: class I SAM-dependent DNA methyltransferase [Dactylosporangium sp.]|nr:class I SAM-dependent DNA methyltransferase [Dactylosporangium sp.]
MGPGQLHGLEINAYARELAQVVVWIGYLKWKVDNGFPGFGDPVLEPLETIRLQDALLDLSDPDNPKEAEWPAADFIIGNPPFLGGKRLRTDTGVESSGLRESRRGARRCALALPTTPQPGIGIRGTAHHHAHAAIEAGRTRGGPTTIVGRR